MNAESAYSILNLSPGASPGDIRSAFRKKAKLLHPDKNQASDAHEQFVLLHEAYAKLSGIENKSAPDIRRDMEKDRMERARKAAANYARMKYQEYLKEVEMYHTSPYAWVFRILYYGLFLLYLICAMSFAFIPLVLLSYGIKWFLVSCPLWVLSAFTFSYAYDWKKEIDPLFK